MVWVCITFGLWPVIQTQTINIFILLENKWGITNLSFSRHALLNSNNIILFKKNKEKKRSFFFMFEIHMQIVCQYVSQRYVTR